MRVPRLLRSKAFYLGALLLTSSGFIAKWCWEQEQITLSLAPYVKDLVSFKLYRPDNHLHTYIEDLVQMQVSPDAKSLLIVRHAPHDDPLHLQIERAEFEPNKTVMLLTHHHGNLYRIYLHADSFMLTVVGSLENVLAIETGVRLSEDQVQAFKKDPLYLEPGSLREEAL
jgi:hypothetical protein